MKPVDFAYRRPGSVREAVAILGGEADAKLIAGGQTLGPMLNLRLARPSLLVDISRLAELQMVTETADGLLIGAGVTHAAIEDQRIPDLSLGLLTHVASGIAYRAVRNRGTVGGSMAHADPAADWLATFVALGARVEIAGARGTRSLDAQSFVTGALTTVLAADEIVTGLHIPRLSPAARWGYHKICRKTGEFADAIGVIVDDPARGFRRLVAGATGGAAIVIDDAPHHPDANDWHARLAGAGYGGDAYDLQLHAVALARACEGARRQ